jgi:predicted lipoprotein with Yx(FWY)xxD motif
LVSLAANAAGKNLTDSNGMTVYTYDKDTVANVSTCYGSCQKAWPPVVDTGAALTAPYSTVLRKDGSRQLAYEGKPLYLFFNDKSPGDANGDGIGGVWHTVDQD